jgi:RNA polymerase sigma factor (sigma-70 family)
MADSEQDLLRRYVKNGDADAFRALVKAHQGMVFSVCWRVLRNATEAEDAAQNCFLQLARKAATLHPPIAGWLHDVALRLSLNQRRDNHVRRAREMKAARESLMSRDTNEPDWEAATGVLDETIADLPERLRVPVILHYLEGRTQEDIAAQLSLTHSAISKRLSKGIESVRKSFAAKDLLFSVGTLSALFTAHAIQAAPSTLAAAAGKTAVAGLMTGGKAVGIGGMTVAKLDAISAVAALVVIVGGVVAYRA